MATKIKRISYKNKTVGTFLGITLLVLGVTAGVVIAQNPQIFTPKAACPAGQDCNECKTDDDCAVGQACITRNGIRGCEKTGGQQACVTTICPPNYYCAKAGICSPNGGGGGGSVCIGCYSSTNTDQGLYGVTHLHVAKTSATAALITWMYGPGRVCTNRGTTIIFIGTNQSKVATNCGFSGTSTINDNSPLPAGCSWVRKVPSDVTSYNTTQTPAGVKPIVLSPTTKYYFRAVTRYLFTDSSGEDSGAFCGSSTFIVPTPTPKPTTTPKPTLTPTPTVTPTPTPPIIICNKKLDIALVIDRSSTMTQTEPDGRQKLAWARDAAVTFMNVLKGTGTTSVNVAVDSFGAQGNDGTGILTSNYNSTLNIALTSNFGSVITALSGVVYSKPGTCIQCGIRIGNSQLTNTANRRIEILLSDGMANHDWAGHDASQIPSGSPSSKTLAIQEANNGRSKGVEYRVLGYGQNVAGQLDQATLLSIAGSSANYTYQPDATQWSNAFVQILKDLCN